MRNEYKIRQVPRMFEEVTKQIIQYIYEEELKSGAKLPTERKLSELLGVSRSSVREGLRILELLNYLESRQGGGTFVANAPPFLLPQSIIKQVPNKTDLDKYYEMALTAAEKIVQLGVKKEIDPPRTFVHESDFWTNFSKFLNYIGTRLSNDYYISLWNSISYFLYTHNFFKQVEKPFSLESLLEVYSKQNKEEIRKFFTDLEQADL